MLKKIKSFIIDSFKKLFGYDQENYGYYDDLSQDPNIPNPEAFLKGFFRSYFPDKEIKVSKSEGKFSVRISWLNTRGDEIALELKFKYFSRATLYNSVGKIKKYLEITRIRNF